MPPVVDAGWVSNHFRDVVLADVRFYLDGRAGEAAYSRQHLPGAIWVDLDSVLSGAPAPTGGRHPLPDPAEFAAKLGKLGVGDQDCVVAYDDQGGGYAARLVWMLRTLGQPAALLDGGLESWRGAFESGPCSRPPQHRASRSWPQAAVRTADEVHRAVRTPGCLLLDARAAGRYSGEASLAIDVRRGHIPGAVNAPWQSNLRPDGRFLGPRELSDRFEALGADRATDVIVYCGSGVTACHNLLAMERAGLRRGSLYPGSWSEWSADLSREAVLGPEP